MISLAAELQRGHSTFDVGRSMFDVPPFDVPPREL